MFEQLLIRNFQKHERLLLEFDKHVTTIVGATDAGKSALIRALSWVILNAPNGDSFIRWGAPSARAKLTVDGRVVFRKRGSGANLYRLDGKEFKAFGSEVPPEVAALLRMGELNFQRQHDRVFWFSESSGAVSKKLNEIVDLGAIDDSLSFIASSLRSARAEKTVIEDRLVKARERKKELLHVPEMNTELLEVERLANASWEAKKWAQLLHELIESARILKKKATTELPSFNAVTAARKLAADTYEKAFSLRGLIEEAERLESKSLKLKKAYVMSHNLFHRQYKTCPHCKGTGHIT